MRSEEDGGGKSVVITGLVVVLVLLIIAQVCFWASETFKPAPKTYIAQEGDCFILK